MRTLFLLALITAAASGCVRYSRKFDASGQRIGIRFEDREASELFYRSFSQPSIYHNDLDFTVAPILLCMNIENTLHEVEYYNSLVRKADLDQNGVITKEEASALPGAIPPAAE